MMRYARHLGRARLVGEQRQAGVDLHGVGRDDLAAQQLCEADGDLGLAQGGGSDQCHDR